MSSDNNKKILILDMQPIDPPIGGGRLRLLGLYHNLGENCSAHYIGTYDWPGERYRDHNLSNTLRETNIPLSDAHFAACRSLQDQVNGKTVIDSTFHRYAFLSDEYVNFVKQQVKASDVIVFSHPWIFPLAKDEINSETQLVIYDSQNVEGYLKYTLLDDNGGVGSEIVREVVRIEYELCHFADKVLVCSQADRDLFNRLYNVPIQKMKVTPNCTFTEKIKPASHEEKKHFKQKLGLQEQWTAIFIGSNFAPNIEACNFICRELAPHLPETTFIIGGGVGDGIEPKLWKGLGNVKVTGYMTDEEKQQYLSASDYAINPMFSGSGTNIKMFDFLAAGLPIVTTKTGARGITEADYAGIFVRNLSAFISIQKEITGNALNLDYFARVNRELAEQQYSWEKLSPKLGFMLKNILSQKRNSLTLGKKNTAQPKMAIMSSWDIRCGIAENTRYLISEMEKNVELYIIANANTEFPSLYTIDDIPRNIYPLWNYDYLNWRDSEIYTPGIINLLRQHGITKFNIQYHFAFYKQDVLLELLQRCAEAGIEVTITIHNSKGMGYEHLAGINKLGAKIIVHTPAEQSLLIDQGIQNVFYVPLGIQDHPDENANECREKLGITGHPVIGSFGFLRPHKGVLEAIKSINILKEEYPNILLLGVNALYPSDDSKQYLAKCEALIQELELNRHVKLITSFMEMKDIIHYLHASDLILLPYHASKEGASAAANTGIAAKRALVISKSAIFDEVREAGYILDSIEPAFMAREVKTLLADPDLMKKLKIAAMNYLDKNSYPDVAKRYTEIMDLSLPAIGGIQFPPNKGAPADYEMILQKVYEAILETGDYAIDVGAHVGRHTFPIARKIAPDGKVFAVEPLPACQKELRQKIAEDYKDLDGVISLYPYALSDYEGHSEFIITVDAPGYSGLRERTLDFNTRSKKIQVEIRKADNLFSNLDFLKYIKIDAEGGEFDILKGCANTIVHFRPVVTFEFGQSSYAEYSVNPEEVFYFWKEKGYNIFDINGKLMESEKLFAKSSIDQNVWDYVAVPSERKDLIEKILRAINTG